MLRNFLGLIKNIIVVLYNEIKIEVKIKANQNLLQVCKICRHERDLIFFPNLSLFKSNFINCNYTILFKSCTGLARFSPFRSEMTNFHNETVCLSLASFPTQKVHILMQRLPGPLKGETVCQSYETFNTHKL